MSRRNAITLREYRETLTPPAKKPKYGNVKVEIDGHVFDSKAEGWRYIELRDKQKKGAIRDLKLQPEFTLRSRDGTEISKYRGDFQYGEVSESGDHVLRTVVEDVKGAKTDLYKLKKKWMLADYGIEIHEVQA